MKKLNKKKCMIVSVNAKKEFEKIKYQLTIETLSKVKLEGTFPNLIEYIYRKPTANNTLNVKKLDAF